MRRLVPLIVVSALLAAPGCEPDDVPTDADATEDVDQELLPIPSFTVEIEASRVDGNVPLDVRFEAVVTGVAAEELELRWLLNDTERATGEVFDERFLFAGPVTVELEATYRRSDGETKVVVATVIVKARACADLSFDRFTIGAPSDLPPGGTLTVGAGTLVNGGDAISDPFSVALGLSLDAVWDATTDILVAGETITSMPTGLGVGDSELTMVGRTFVLPADIAEGSYFAFLVADPDGAVNECQEANNLEPATNTLDVDLDAGKLPNLAISNVSIAPTDVAQGDSVIYRFTLANSGEADARNFRHAFWLSEDQVLDDDDRPLALASDEGSRVHLFTAGTTQPFSLNYRVPADLPDGTYWVIGKVDALETIAESDESDNVAVSAAPLTMVFEPPDCLDLALVDLVVQPTRTYWGGSVRMEITVANPGTRDTPDGWLFRAYMGIQAGTSVQSSFVIGTYPLAAVPAGGEETFEIILPIDDELPVGPKWFWGAVDPTSSLVECAETNNTRLYPEPVIVAAQASIDVAVERFAFHPPNVAAGDVIKVEYDLTNHGTAVATSFQVAVVLSPDAAVSREGIAAGVDVVVDRRTIASLDPGELVTEVRDVLIPLGLDHAIETYRVAVLADVDGFLTSDTSITNNLRYAEQLLTVSGAEGGCFEDLFEQDDVRADATDIDVSGGPFVQTGLGSCGDADWFEIVVPEGHSLLVDVDARSIVAVPAVGANLVVELVDPAGNVAQRATFGPHYEVRAFAVPAIGTWAVRVSGATAMDRATYDLKVTTLPPRVGVDVVAYDARPAPAVSYPGGRVVVAWREVNLGTLAAAQRTSRIWLSKDRVLDGVDLALGEMPSAALAPQGTDARDTTVSVPSNVPGGSWYLLVQADADGDVVEVDEANNLAAGGPITLDPLKVCNDDLHEPNDEQGIATPIADGERLSDAVVCPGLDDWFAVELDIGQAFEAELAYPYDPSKGKLVLELWDPDGQGALVTSTSTSSLRVALPSAWESGRWLVRVANEAGALTAPYTYELAVSVTPGPIAAYCEGDRYEPNNAQAHGVGIGCGLVAGTLCNLDNDWFVLQGKVAQQITVTMTNAKSEIYAKLYVPGGTNPVQTIYGGTPGGSSMSYTPTGTGPLLLKLEPRSGPTTMTSFAYTLRVTGLDGADLALEALTSPFAAVDRGEDAGVSFGVKNQCTAASAPFEVGAFLSIDDALGTDDVLLGTWPVGALAAATSVPLEPKVTIPLSTMPGLYWLVVQADSGAAVTEGNEIDNVMAVPLEVREPCAPDAWEPNDSRGAARPIGLPDTLEDTIVCPNDQDWYAIAAEAGDRVRVEVLFEHADGDLDLRVYGSGAAPIAISTSTDDDEAVVIDVPVATTLYLRIAGFADASAPYTLITSLD